LVTEIGPDLLPGATVARSSWLPATTTDDAGTPPNATLVTVSSSAPVTTTCIPAPPPTGENVVIVGAPGVTTWPLLDELLLLEELLLEEELLVEELLLDEVDERDDPDDEVPDTLDEALLPVELPGPPVLAELPCPLLLAELAVGPAPDEAPAEAESDAVDPLLDDDAVEPIPLALVASEPPEPTGVARPPADATAALEVLKLELAAPRPPVDASDELLLLRLALMVATSPEVIPELEERDAPRDPPFRVTISAGGRKPQPGKRSAPQIIQFRPARAKAGQRALQRAAPGSPRSLESSRG
jgi:hypothetical protein